MSCKTVHKFMKNLYPEISFWESEKRNMALSAFLTRSAHISIWPFLILVANPIAILLGLFPEKGERKTRAKANSITLNYDIYFMRALEEPMAGDRTGCEEPLCRRISFQRRLLEGQPTRGITIK